jgi:hypothetical protein
MGMSRKIATRFACAVIREGKVDIGLASFVRHSFDGMQTLRGIIGVDMPEYSEKLSVYLTA